MQSCPNIIQTLCSKHIKTIISKVFSNIINLFQINSQNSTTLLKQSCPNKLFKYYIKLHYKVAKQSCPNIILPPKNTSFPISIQTINEVSMASHMTSHVISRDFAKKKKMESKLEKKKWEKQFDSHHLFKMND
jgi:hypothetical protein